jgi:cell shape-determining protein MreC
MNKNKRDLRIYFKICFLFLVFVIVVCLILNSIFSTDDKVWLDGNAWATIIIGAISSSCTLFLGFLAYWQNKNQRQDYQENKDKIEKLEAKILELENKNK